MKKFTLLAAVVALSVGAYGLPSHAATLTAPKAGIGSAPAIALIDCVIHVHKHWVRRHVRPDGTVVEGHWVHRRVKVCD